MVVMPAVLSGEQPVDARAGVPARLLVLFTVTLAFWVFGAALDTMSTAILAGTVLVVGVGFGEVLETDRYLRSIPGWAAGVVAVVVLTVLAIFADAPLTLAPLLLVPFGAGLDFRRVTRLRTYLYLSTLSMVPALVGHETVELGLTVVWLAGFAASLWFLRLAADTYLPAPQPLAVTAAPEATATDDLARIVVIGLLVSLVLALALSTVSFDFLQSGGGQAGSGSGSVSGSGSGSGSGAGSGSESGSGSGSGSESGSGSGSSAVPDSRLLLAVLAAVGAVVLAVVWLRTRPGDEAGAAAPESWIADLLERIEKEGADGGAPRRSAETVLAYTDRVASDVFGDDRVRSVGQVISAGLYASGPMRPESRVWAADTFDLVMADMSQRDGADQAAR